MSAVTEAAIEIGAAGTVELYGVPIHAILLFRMADEPQDPELRTVLEEQARSLQRLIDDAQRIQREITAHLSKLRRAGDPSTPNKKS